MTIESNISEKVDLEKTISIDKKIRVAAACAEVLSLAAVFANPLALVPVAVALTVHHAADHQATSNQKKLDDMNPK